MLKVLAGGEAAIYKEVRVGGALNDPKRHQAVLQSRRVCVAASRSLQFVLASTAQHRALACLQALWPGVCAEQPGETEALCTCRAVAVSAVSPLLKYSCKITSACRQSDPADLSHAAGYVRSSVRVHRPWLSTHLHRTLQRAPGGL